MQNWSVLVPFISSNVRWRPLSATVLRLFLQKYDGALCRPRSRKERSFLGGVGFGFLRTLGAGVGIFYPTSTPEVQFKYLLHRISKLGILTRDC